MLISMNFANLRHHREKRTKFLCSNNVHPQTLEIVKTRAAALKITIDVIEDLNSLPNSDMENYCGILLQYPDTNGDILDLTETIQTCKSKGTLVIIATDLLALTLIKPPGEFGGDIAIGTSQRFGIPLNYGGPHAAFLACRNNLTRIIPGRVVGLTKDSQGNQALRLALQTREQHIRRDKATSNICTAQALLANMSAMYAIYHGPQGLKAIAKEIHDKTLYLADKITQSGQHEVVTKLPFDTLKIKTKSQKRIRSRAESQQINLRYFPDGIHVGVSLDEIVTYNDLVDLVWIFEGEKEV